MSKKHSPALVGDISSLIPAAKRYFQYLEKLDLFAQSEFSKHSDYYTPIFSSLEKSTAFLQKKSFYTSIDISKQ